MWLRFRMDSVSDAAAAYKRASFDSFCRNENDCKYICNRLYKILELSFKNKLILSCILQGLTFGVETPAIASARRNRFGFHEIAFVDVFGAIVSFPAFATATLIRQKRNAWIQIFT